MKSIHTNQTVVDSVQKSSIPASSNVSNSVSNSENKKLKFNLLTNRIYEIDENELIFSTTSFPAVSTQAKNIAKDYKLINYMGSKKQYFSKFQEVFNTIGSKMIEVDTYIEGFTGSFASVLINLQFVKAKRVVINDLNERLINIYRNIKSNPEAVYQALIMIEDKFQSLMDKSIKRLASKYPKEKRAEIQSCEDFYKYIRKYINKNEFSVTHAACMIWILNRQFNGRYSENNNRDFNASYNWSTARIDLKKIKKSIFGLYKLFNSKDTEFIFETLDIDTLITKYNNHDTFIYLDPPYINSESGQYSNDRKNQENSFLNVSTHIKLLNSCSYYKYVMFSNNDHSEFRNYFPSYVNFDRKNDTSGKNSDKPRTEILGLKINTTTNNPEYAPAVEEQIALKTGTDNVAIELEFDKKLEILQENIQNELKCSNNKNYKLTDTVSICGIEEASFRYKGNWKSNHRMKFQDLKKLYIAGVQSRKDIVKNNSVSGLARQHATYFYKAMEQLNKIEIDSSVIPNESINNPEFVPTDSEYKISIGTCFSGMGAPEYALKSLNIPHTSIFVCDNNKYCRQVLKQNYSPENIHSDIRNLDGYKYAENTEIVVSGSPCQDFSILNSNRKGLKGSKSSLFFEGYRVLKEIMPKFFIFENVTGLLSSNNGKDFKTVIKLFEELNYDVYVKKLNPAKLGGYTARVRVFFVLVRKDIGIPFHFPKESNIIKPIKEILIPGDYQYIPENQFIAPKTPIKLQRGLIKTVCKWLGDKWNMYNRVIDSETSTCPTINCRGHILVDTPQGKRLLDIPELIKAQGYGEDIDFSGISKSQIKSMIGNTIEVTTMKLLIQEIVRIDKLHYNNLKKQEKLLVS